MSSNRPADPSPATWRSRFIPSSLTSRLVVTVVVLVAVAGLVLTAATALVVRAYLEQRLDVQVAAALARAGGPAPGELDPAGPRVVIPDLGGRGPDSPDSPGGRGPGRDPLRDLLGQGGGTLVALLSTSSTGLVVSTERDVPSRALDEEALEELADLPADRQGRTVFLPGEGSYRLMAVETSTGETLVTGLPTAETERTVNALAVAGALLSLVVVALAGLAGRGVVRRQLRPLRQVAATAAEVATLPLGSGAVEMTPRVPTELARDRSEVGRVGGALNLLLGHVEAALAERHRSEQRVRQFVADASHELRTPLTTIQGYSELARRRPEDAEHLAGVLAKVETESHRMSSLVEDLLLLARLDSGRPLARDDVDLTRLVLEAVADAQVVGADHTWRLALPDDPVTVVGDEMRLHQLLSNLLTNARRHTPAGTTVTTGVWPDAGRVELTVADDGHGLPGDLRDRAFERFVRGDASRHRETAGATDGAGLGLSLVAAIAHAHGGEATVESAPGRTIFTIVLPRG